MSNPHRGHVIFDRRPTTPERLIIGEIGGNAGRPISAPLDSERPYWIGDIRWFDNGTSFVLEQYRYGEGHALRWVEVPVMRRIS